MCKTAGKTTQPRCRLPLTFLKTTTEGQFSQRAQPITDRTEMLQNTTVKHGHWS